MTYGTKRHHADLPVNAYADVDQTTGEITFSKRDFGEFIEQQYKLWDAQKSSNPSGLLDFSSLRDTMQQLLEFQLQKQLMQVQVSMIQSMTAGFAGQPPALPPY